MAELVTVEEAQGKLVRRKESFSMLLLEEILRIQGRTLRSV